VICQRIGLAVSLLTLHSVLSSPVLSHAITRCQTLPLINDLETMNRLDDALLRAGVASNKNQIDRFRVVTGRRISRLSINVKTARCAIRPGAG